MTDAPALPAADTTPSPAEFAFGLIDRAVAEGRLSATAEGLDVAATDTAERLDEVRADSKTAQPNPEDDSAPQERIILAAALHGDADNGPRWGRFRTAIGLQPSQEVPGWIWSAPGSARVAEEIDAAFRGRRDVRRINGRTLVECFRLRAEREQVAGSLQGFAEAVASLQGDGSFWTENDFAMAIEILQSKRARGALRMIAKELERSLRADLPVEQAVDVASASLDRARDLVRGRLGVSHDFDDFETLHYALKAGMEAERRPALSTRIPSFDMAMQGGVKLDDTGKLFVIGARTGVGKTTVGIAAAMGLVLSGASTLFLSCELNGKEVGSRALAHYAYTRRLLQCQSWILEGRGNRREVPVGYDDMLGMWRQEELAGRIGRWRSKALFLASAEDFVELIYAAKAKDPSLSAVFVDHFHAMRPTKGGPSNRAQEMEERILFLNQAAKAAGVDLFLLAQLNREAELAQRPQKEHINGTDAIAQLASAVWLLEYPKRQEGEPFDASALTCWIGKARNGLRLAGAQLNLESAAYAIDRNHCVVSDVQTLMEAKAQGARLAPDAYSLQVTA